MPAPKGMRAINFPISPTDAVYVYSDAKQIWLQLRRHVPTAEEIGRPSFKVAFALTPSQAIDLARELLTAATQQPAPPAPASAKSTAASAPPATLPAKAGKPWTSDEEQRLLAAFDAKKPIPELAKIHKRSVGGIESRLFKLGKITEAQRTILLPENK